MYEPIFNSVLVKIDDKDAKWGSGNDESMLGKSYSKGTIIAVGDLVEDDKYQQDILDEIIPELNKLKGKEITWNMGAEAGTTFDFDGKLFGFIYWNDIRGVLVNPVKKKAAK